MNQSDEHHATRCPSCASVESSVPIITVNGTTLWECTNEPCSVRWRTETSHEGLGENPDPQTIERFLDGAAEYRNEENLQELADDIARLYREPRAADEGRNTERIPCPR